MRYLITFLIMALAVHAGTPVEDACALIRLKRFDAAKTLLLTELQKEHNVGQAATLLGKIYEHQNRKSEAIDAYKQALRAERCSPEDHHDAFSALAKLEPSSAEILAVADELLSSNYERSQVIGRSLRTMVLYPSSPSPSPQKRVQGSDSNPVPSPSSDQYAYIDKPMTWDAAVTYCKAAGGRLAEISTRSDLKEIEKIIPNIKESAWIAYTDRAKEGTWTWLSGDRGTVQNWHSEPKSRRRFNVCVILSNGKWHEAYGHDKKPFILERVIE